MRVKIRNTKILLYCDICIVFFLGGNVNLLMGRPLYMKVHGLLIRKRRLPK